MTSMRLDSIEAGISGQAVGERIQRARREAVAAALQD